MPMIGIAFLVWGLSCASRGPLTKFERASTAVDAPPAADSLPPLMFAAEWKPTSGRFLLVERIYGWPLGLRPLDPATASRVAHYRLEIGDAGWTLEEINSRGVVLQREAGQARGGRPMQLQTFNRWGLMLHREIYSRWQSHSAHYELKALSGRNGLSPCESYLQLFDSVGHVIRQDCLDTQDRRIEDERGVARLRLAWQPGPRMSSAHHFDAADRPVRTPAGYHSIHYRYGSDMCLQEQWTENESVALVADMRAVARRRYQRSPECLPLEESNFDQEDQRVVALEGTHRTVWHYRHGLAARVAYFDANGLPMRHGSLKVHAIRHRFTAQGDLRTILFYDEHGRACPSREGPQQRQWVYDSLGRTIRQRVFNAEGLPSLDRRGVHGIQYENDEFGRPILQSYLDTALEPTRDNVDQVHAIRLRYDGQGRLAERRFLDENGQPMARWSGEFRICHGYNDQGLEQERTTLDAEGRPLQSADGSTRRHFEYDRRQRLVAVRWYNLERPVQVQSDSTVSGFHLVRRAFDRFNQVTEVRYFGVDEQPALARVHPQKANPKIDLAVHRIEYRRSGGLGPVVEQACFGIDSAAMLTSLNCTIQPCVKESGIALQPPPDELLPEN